MKKKITLTAAAIMLCSIALALTKPKVYVNPGHGSWGPDDRPLPTIPYPMTAETGRPDTCGFYESNTNLWKTEEIGRILKATNEYYIKYSRRKNGPYPYKAGASDAEKYNRPLAVISAEVDSYRADYFISVHSNAAADGALANYPLFLYRGKDQLDDVSMDASKPLCEEMWPWHIEAMKAGFEFQSAYTSSKNVRGDRSFYNYTWQNDKGYFGYLGVLMHACPGYLVEGYFHTYQPSRHRALNADWCRMEGRRYARGIIDHFKTTADTLGCIMGDVRTKSKSTSGLQYYAAADGTQDIYMPVNGALVRLKDAQSNVLRVYNVDENYNGIFVFNDLQPGTYYIDLYCPGYRTQQVKSTANKYIVKANQTQYKTHYMVAGTTTDLTGPTTNEEIANSIALAVADDTQLPDHNLVRIFDTEGRMVLQTTRQNLESASLPTGIYVMESAGRSVKYYRK